MSKLPTSEHFLSSGNLGPNVNPFFKPKLKPKCFLLNRLPVAVVERVPVPGLVLLMLMMVVVPMVLLLQGVNSIDFPMKQIQTVAI